jgi:hypothetical protein
MPNPVPPPISNTFYIAGNIIFDLATGEAKNVLTLVNKPEDASIFTATDAQNYLNFVQLRAQNIVWTIEHLPPLTTTLINSVRHYVAILFPTAAVKGYYKTAGAMFLSSRRTFFRPFTYYTKLWAICLL